MENITRIRKSTNKKISMLPAISSSIKMKVWYEIDADSVSTSVHHELKMLTSTEVTYSHFDAGSAQVSEDL